MENLFSLPLTAVCLFLCGAPLIAENEKGPAPDPVKVNKWGWDVSVSNQDNALRISYKGQSVMVGDSFGLYTGGRILPAGGELTTRKQEQENEVVITSQFTLKENIRVERRLRITPEYCLAEVTADIPAGHFDDKRGKDEYYLVDWNPDILRGKPAQVYMKNGLADAGVLGDPSPAGLWHGAYGGMCGILFDTDTDLGGLRIEFNKTVPGSRGWQLFFDKNRVWTAITERGEEPGWLELFSFKIIPNQEYRTKELAVYEQMAESYSIPAENMDVLVPYCDREYLTGFWKAQWIPDTEDNPENDTGTREKWFSPDYDVSSWYDQPVPWVWDQDYPGKNAKQTKIPRKGGRFQGVGWYRTGFSVDESKKGKRILLHFDKVATEAVVYVNGKKAGSHLNTFAGYGGGWWGTDESFALDITDAVKFRATNTVAVRVHNNGPADGGIAGAVRLDYVPVIYVRNMRIASDTRKGSIRVKCDFKNTTDARQDISIFALVEPWQGRNSIPDSPARATRAKLGKISLAPGEHTESFILTMDKPVLWEIDYPQLYLLRLEGTGKAVGENAQLGVERFGFREFTHEGNYFYLNGKKIFLFGATQHTPVTYNRFGDAEQYFKLMKELGHNHVRFHTSRLPEPVYQICDELGITVCAEFFYATVPLADKKQWEVDHIQDVKKEGVNFKLVADATKKWVRNLHNHPCVVTWSGGNEMHEGRASKAGTTWLSDYLADFYDIVKETDLQNRPVTASSGGHIEGYTKPTKTDYLDIHYTDMYCMDNIAHSEPGVEAYRKKFSTAYSREEFPMIDGECLLYVDSLSYKTLNRAFALSCGVASPAINLKRYLQITSWDPQRFVWFDFYRIGFRNIGVRPIAEGDYAEAVAQLLKIPFEQKRMMEGKLQGYEHFVFPLGNKKELPANSVYRAVALDRPFFEPFPGAEILAQVQKPLYIAVKSPFQMNIIAGNTFQAPVWIMNHSRHTAKDVNARISVWSGKKKVYVEEIDAGDMEVFDIHKHDLIWKAPQELSGHIRLQLELFKEGKLHVTNSYPLYVMSGKEFEEPITTDRKIALYDSAGRVFAGLDKEMVATSEVMKHWQIPFAPITDFKKLSDYDVLIIGYASLDDEVMAAGGEINEWVASGGRLVCFEQIKNTRCPWDEGHSFEACNRWEFCDRIKQYHPVLEGFRREDLFRWSPDHMGGALYGSFIRPINESVILAGATGQKPAKFGMTLAEYRLGKGRVMLSTMELHQRFGKDGVATQLLRNILEYCMGKWDNPFAPLFICKDLSISRIDRKDVVLVNLRPYATRSFIDKVAGDGKGGWDDNGPDNDLSSLPTGVQYFQGCPYDIIRPEQNNDKSCILLKGKPRLYFPEKIEGIKVNAKLKWLRFLQTGCYMGSFGKVAEYVIHYAGGKTAAVPVVAEQNIRDWGKPSDTPQAPVAWCGHAGQLSGIGVFSYYWENPCPDVTIESIDFVKVGEEGVPVLIAITGEVSIKPFAEESMLEQPVCPRADY